jgi:hypothetical protein
MSRWLENLSHEKKRRNPDFDRPASLRLRLEERLEMMII